MYGKGYLKRCLYSGYYLAKGLYNTAINALQDLIKNCGLISYADTVVDGFMEDQVGDETRPSVKAKYIENAGLIASIGLLNTALTYLDADTLLDVAGTTDGSGDFTFPSAKVANIKIASTGDYFKFEEGAGDTIADHVNGRIAKLSSTPTWVEVNNIYSRADQIGYSVAENNQWAWDESLTDVIFNTVVIPNMNANLSVAYFSETPLVTFILDTVIALNGYSLRKLKSTATKAVRVRRSSDNAELDFGFLGEDLDEVALTTFVGAGDGFVVTLYNQVDDGSTDNMTQSTQSEQPRIVANGVVVTDGVKASMDMYPLSATKELGITKTFTQPFVVSQVLKSISVGNRFSFRNQSDFLAYMGTDSSNWRMSAGTLVTSSVASDLNLTVFCSYFNGLNSVVSVNEIDDIVNAGTNGIVNPLMGGSWRGIMSETIILVDDTQKDTLRLNQQSYYSIA